MAKTLGSTEERLIRIFEIRDFVLEKIQKKEKFSTRSIAKHFTENNYPISNNTVDIYLNELEKLDYDNYKIIKFHLNQNKPKTIEDKEVRIRVFKATNLLLLNYDIIEIAGILNSTPDTIYRDLTVRLPKIETKKEILLIVAKILNKHRMQNLINQQPQPKKTK